jgi:two-component system, NtrC family, response regulator AtoC
MEKYTILIADDDEMFREMISEILSEEGAHVLIAENGEKAEEMAKKEMPDLILFDMMMPKKTGAEALKMIRKSGEWGANVPAILLTNMSSAEVPIEDLGGKEKTEILLKTDWTLENLSLHIKKRVCP